MGHEFSQPGGKRHILHSSVLLTYLMDNNIHYLLDKDGYVKHPYVVKCMPLPMLTMSKPEKTDC